ncbi:Acg family FMN-binding oxidoreductase [Aquipuribacter nitratireducens]|uniref:Acg family FMN-binding oxidoreductase n=1 Tax=Aquipuribacter nitratireducens TaxID=650104 RepID=A0ABW0GPY9_9MICO
MISTTSPRGTTDVDAADAVVEAMAEAARWAPSVHNTQPWVLRRLPDGLRVAVDDARALPVLDPDARLRTISCGAAAANAAIAAAGLGVRTSTRLLPDGPRAAAVADVLVTGPREATEWDRALARAVAVRRTHRRLHARGDLGPELLDALRAVAADVGARLVVLDDLGRHRLARLLVRAAHEQERNPRLLAETRSWLRPPRGHHEPHPTDGILLASLGTTPYPTDSIVREVGHVSRLTGSPVRDEVEASTTVVLMTPGDGRRDHAVAGLALERVWLEATAAGVVATFADQATQQRVTRDDVSALAGLPGHAQLVLRLGRPLVDVRIPPRRPLADVLDPAPHATTEGSPRS